MSKQRRQFTAEQKAVIVRRHLADKKPVSDLADEYGVQPGQIHTWVHQVLAQAERAFDRGAGSRKTQASQDQRKISHLQEKLNTKNEVIAELMQEHVQLKKGLGEL